jgi:hypothetical protein
MSRLAALASLLSLSACALVDPAPPAEATLHLACTHVDAWWEGVYPCASGSCSYATGRPLRATHPLLLTTQVDADADAAAVQTACADVCVAAAESGFAYACPDTGWQVARAPASAPPAAPVDPALADWVDACYPDSACGHAFAAPVGAHLLAPAAAPIALHRGQADFVGRSDDGTLALRLGDARVDHRLAGLAEYSPGRCAESRCPFYLANLRLDDDGAGSTVDLAGVTVGLTGLRLDLARPALGALDPATGAVVFPPGALDLRVRVDLAAGPFAASGPRDLRLRNPVEVRGEFTAGALTLAAAVPLPDLGEAALSLAFAPVARPPVAALTLPAELRARGGVALPQRPTAASRLHAAHDPDGDLAGLHWVVDGVPGARELPVGEHEVELWVTDRRGALARSGAQTVTVTP